MMTLGDSESAINMVKDKTLDESVKAFPTGSIEQQGMNKLLEHENRKNHQVLRESGNVYCASNIVLPVGQVNSKLSSYTSSYLQPPLPKPSPAVSNRGLMIVQVQNEQQSSSYRLDSVKEPVFKTYVAENDNIIYNSSNKKSEIESNNINMSQPTKIEMKVDPSAAAASHQLIHGYPPHTFLPEDEEEDEEEAEDETDDPDYNHHDETDEGYRTNSSVASGSPSISSIDSPNPREETCAVGKKTSEEV